MPYSVAYIFGTTRQSQDESWLCRVLFRNNVARSKNRFHAKIVAVVL